MSTTTSTGTRRAAPKNACPHCGDQGKGVKAITLEALLTADALSDAGDLDAYRHCPAPGCDVAYYRPLSDVTIGKEAVAVRIGTKETTGERPVCYCFDHSWNSIEDELRAAGTTGVVETITAHCKNGDDRCPENNPQGSCCLGNVRRAVKEGKAKLKIIDTPAAPSPTLAKENLPACCASEESAQADDWCTDANAGVDLGALAPPGIPERPALAERGGLFAAVGALTAAVLSSACCWLPLFLIAIGAGTTSVAGFFEEYRLLLLIGTAGLLGAGFYFVYLREEKCEPGSACAVPHPRLKRFNKVTLWVATGFAALFAFFPNYIGSVIELADGAGGNVAAVSVEVAGAERVFAVQGMTCESCTMHIKDTIAKLPDTSAEVSYSNKSATVKSDNPAITDAVIVAAIAEAGYKASPAKGQVYRFDVEGMTCESCVGHIENVLGKVAGVRSASVSYEEKLAIVVGAQGGVKAVAVIGAIAEAGYQASISE